METSTIMTESTESRRGSIEERLGYKRLNRVWAKAEILLGLIAAGVGIGLLSQPLLDDLLIRNGAGVGLFTLGGYLALAGHRSHMYQSANEHLTYLSELIETIHQPSKRP